MKAASIARFVLFYLCSACLVLSGRTARAEEEEEKKIYSSECHSMALDHIPVADIWDKTHAPEDTMRITQTYNTSPSEGFYHNETLMHGHDGLDIHEWGAWGGKNNVYSVHDGRVVVSHEDGEHGAWGESVIVASRANEFSEEIITHHYHHLHATRDQGIYKTTRRVNACDKVKAGQVLAKEGGSGGWPVHLHWSVRRWRNIDELNEAIKHDATGLYGSGYTFGNDKKLENFLDPEGYYYSTFQDYQADEYGPHWSFTFALRMKLNGFEFGHYDGRFGKNDPVTRREAARWIKIAAEQLSRDDTVSAFDDVPTIDPDFPYVEALKLYPSIRPIINPAHTCKQGGNYFCPDDPINRAEALKMIVLAFYGQEYTQVYKSEIWENSFNTAIGLLSEFLDVDPVNWYASYVYFAAEEGLVASNEYFYPADAITREELAKWIVMGYEHKTEQQHFACSYTVCPLDYFCEPISSTCYPIPQCVPTETETCAVGGGYNGAEPPQDPPPDDPPLPEDPPSQPPSPSCQETWVANTLESCYNNPQGAGNPTLCLQVQQLNGPEWKYRICKQGGVFQNNFNRKLEDENHWLTLNTGLSSMGVPCSQWTTFHLTYIQNYGTSNGAGLAGFVTSPAFCTEGPSCHYRTGSITITKECQ